MSTTPFKKICFGSNGKICFDSNATLLDKNVSNGFVYNTIPSNHFLNPLHYGEDQINNNNNNHVGGDLDNDKGSINRKNSNNNNNVHGDANNNCIETIQCDDVNAKKCKSYIKWYARISCIIALLPMVLFHKNTRNMACLHLILSPITSYFLQSFSVHRCDSDKLNSVSRILCGLCVVLANFSAILMVIDEASKSSHYVLTSSICLGTLQLLIVLRKENVIRGMICTAIAVLVITLSMIAVVVPITTGKRFYQSIGLPFAVLFLESSRH